MPTICWVRARRLLPAEHIGRLAVDAKFRGQGFGRLLLWDATVCALRAEQANFTLLVDAKDDAAVEFYRHYGFVSFATAPAGAVPAAGNGRQNPRSERTVTKLTTYPLRLPRPIKAEVERRAKQDGTSINQFVATAVAEKLAAMSTGEFFCRASRAGQCYRIRPAHVAE